MKPDWCPVCEGHRPGKKVCPICDSPLQEKPIDGVLIGVIVTVVICGGIVLIKILHWIN